MFQSDTHHLHLQCSRYLANQFFKAEIRGGKKLKYKWYRGNMRLERHAESCPIYP